MLRMPKCDTLVVNAFNDCGVCWNGGMGATPLPWAEINAYSEGSGINLTTWERRMVRMMSQQYVIFKNFGTQNRRAVSPYKPELTEEDTLKRAERMAKII